MFERARPANVEPRYALISEGDAPAAAVCLQIVTLDHANLGDLKRRRALRKLGAKIRTRVLVCGNLLVYGQHGVSIAAGADRPKVWQAVAEAIYRIRRAEKLAGSTDIVLLKDFDAAARKDSAVLKNLSYGVVETEPNMVLSVDPAWRGHADYLQSLSSKFRSDIKNRVFKRFDEAGCTLEVLEDVEAHAADLQSLYLEVQGAAGLRPFTVPSGYWPELATLAGAHTRVHVARRDGRILGFIVSVKDGETALAYHIGFDRKVAGEGVPVYLRLLHASLAQAIEFGVRRVSFGRTALEPKARLGCKPCGDDRVGAASAPASQSAAAAHASHGRARRSTRGRTVQGVSFSSRPPVHVALIFEQPEGAIGTLFHFADAPAHVETLRFARAALRELHAHERLRRQSADEPVAVPIRKHLARVDDEAGRRDHRVPGDERRLELRPRRMIGDVAAVVVVAVRDDGVTVVLALVDDVELVAAARTHLVRVQTCRPARTRCRAGCDARATRSAR